MFYGASSYDEMDKVITLSDGTDDYVESGKTIIARGTPQHTFSFWVKPSNEDHDDTGTHYMMVWGSETAQNKWSGIALSNDGRLAHAYHASAKRTVDQILPTPGAWYHVVVVVKSISATTAANRDVEFYIDGELYTGNYDTFGSQNTSTSYYLDWGSGTHTSVRLGSLHSASLFRRFNLQLQTLRHGPHGSRGRETLRYGSVREWVIPTSHRCTRTYKRSFIRSRKYT